MIFVNPLKNYLGFDKKFYTIILFTLLEITEDIYIMVKKIVILRLTQRNAEYINVNVSSHHVNEGCVESRLKWLCSIIMGDAKS